MYHQVLPNQLWLPCATSRSCSPDCYIKYFYSHRTQLFQFFPSWLTSNAVLRYSQQFKTECIVSFAQRVSLVTSLSPWGRWSQQLRDLHLSYWLPCSVNTGTGAHLQLAWKHGFILLMNLWILRSALSVYTWCYIRSTANNPNARKLPIYFYNPSHFPMVRIFNIIYYCF